MDEKNKAIIESILFATGREVSIKELAMALEKSCEEVVDLTEKLKSEYEFACKGVEIIKVKDCYQMCTKKDYYDYVAQVADKKSRPNLSNAALEILSIIAYNPNVTRAEIETIRGVNSDGTIYKLLEYNLIEESGKLDAPGRPTTYATSNKFLKMFGLTSLETLPKLPKYKLDQNQQIVIDESQDDEIMVSNSQS